MNVTTLAVDPKASLTASPRRELRNIDATNGYFLESDLFLNAFSRTSADMPSMPFEANVKARDRLSLLGRLPSIGEYCTKGRCACAATQEKGAKTNAGSSPLRTSSKRLTSPGTRALTCGAPLFYGSVVLDLHSTPSPPPVPARQTYTVRSEGS